jgi:myo-inositol-1(or 4)-monophosphatase
MAMRPTTDSPQVVEGSYLERLEREAVRFARGAGAILMEHFRRPLAVEYKSANRRDPVTEADRKAEAYLREAISQVFPDHGIVGEENPNSAHAMPAFVWVLDPLDGTTNFLNGLPIFASSIAVLHQGRPVAAALFVPDPDGGSVYHARVGGGAHQDGRRLSVADNATPERGRLTGLPAYYWRLYGFRDGLRQRIGEIRSLGSIAYEMAMTAGGTIQACIFNSPKIWDVAGGMLLVTEAGGTVLTRPPKSKQWKLFTAFGADSPTLDQLHDWRGPVLAGNAELTQHIAERIWNRSLRWFRFRRWLTRQRDRMRQGQATTPADGRPSERRDGRG